ncbi:MAG: hypothetical protein AAGC60_04070 [Acidobacteriota bacterium]
MTTNRKLFYGCLGILLAACVFGPGSAWAQGAPCVIPINPDGSVTLPPEGCAYQTPTQIHALLDGLPDGTVIHVGASHGSFLCESRLEQGCTLGGGSLGGTIETSSSTVTLTFDDNNGWTRTAVVPADFEVHTGQQYATQSNFPTRMVRLSGSISFANDPDFAEISISAGSAAGFPGDGYTFINHLGNGKAELSSEFNLGGTMHFVGTPGGRLQGVSATFDFDTVVAAQDDCN